jgi:ribonuclease D
VKKEGEVEKILNLSKSSPSSLVAIDTEFSRERSFFPILSIVQIKYKNCVKIIDCINISRKDIKDLKEILQNKKLIKIFHSYKQDIEAIYQYFGIIPKGCMDLQIIAKNLNIGNQVGYSFLVQKYKNITLEKENQRSNWLRRSRSMLLSR